MYIKYSFLIFKSLNGQFDEFYKNYLYFLTEINSSRSIFWVLHNLKLDIKI